MKSVKPPVPPRPPRNLRRTPPQIPTNAEIEAQLKKFLTEISADSDQHNPDADFLANPEPNPEYIPKFLEKLGGSPWYLKLHPANLSGRLDLQNLVEFIRSRLEKARKDSLLKHVVTPSGSNFPLSYPQEQIWLQMQDSPSSTLYNYSGHFYFAGSVEASAMRETLNLVIQRHESFRAVYLEIDGKPCQRILPHTPCKIQVVQITNMKTLESTLTKNLYMPFEFDKGPMYRWFLYIAQDKFALLQFVCHHLTCDGTGFYILEHEIRSIYAAISCGQAPNLSPIPITYSDFVLWQREAGRFDSKHPSALFWRKYLEGMTALEIPRDRPKCSSIGMNSGRIRFEFSGKLTQDVRNFSRSLGVTPFVTLLAGINGVLYRYVQQPSISLLTAKHGRTNSKLKGIVGHFVNTLVIRTFLDGSQTFGQLVKSINSNLTSIYEHEEYPFQYVLRDLISNYGDAVDKLALFPVFVVMMPKVLGQNPSAALSNYTDIDNNLLTNELTIIFDESSDDVISGFVKYNPALHNRRKILRMVEHFKTLLENNCKTPEPQTLDTMCIIPTDELSQILEFGRGKRVHFNRDQSLIEIFEYVARARPENLAVEEGLRRLSYRSLNEKAEMISLTLLEVCNPVDGFIAILMPQGVPFLSSVLAILKLGKTVVPINVHASVHQVEIMLKELGSPLLLSSRNLLENLKLAYSPVLLVEDLKLELPTNPKKISRTNTRPPYCVFTSGSTGKPKAVIIQDSSIINLSNWAQSQFEITSSDRMLLFSNTAYDAALLEYWPYFLAGASVLIPPFSLRYQWKELMGWVGDHKVTVMNLPTAMAFSLNPADFLPVERFQSLRLLTCGGEKLRPYPYAEFPFKMVNSYGLTEGCVISTSGPFDFIPSIGKPIWNSDVYVLDGNARVVPIGVSGEIFIGGAGVSPGYLNEEELNAQKFVRLGDEVLYRTGDLGYWLADGNLSFVGRRDDQVKLRGQRVEIGEIETVFLSYPSIQQCAVLVEENGGDLEKMLVAFCERKVNSRSPSFDELSNYLKDRLPYYAIPTSIYFLDSFPYNANGKVDKRQFRSPNSNLGAILLQPDFEPVLTPEEQIVAKVWADVLKIPVESIGRQSNFFALGGQSVLIADVINRLQMEPLFVKLKISDLFRDPTFHGFSKLIESKRAQSVLRIEVKDVNNNINCAHAQAPVGLSLQQEQLWLHMQETKDLTLYNESCTIGFKSELNLGAMRKSFFSIFQRHEILKCVICELDGRPYQKIQNVGSESLDLPVLGLTTLSQSEQNDICKAKLSENRLKAFDFERGPLIRFLLLKLSEDSFRLQIVFHHLIMDAVGMNIFEAELKYFYKIYSADINASVALPPLESQYSDFVKAQREQFSGGNEGSRNFWREYLKDVNPLNLQTDRPRKSIGESNCGPNLSGSTGIKLSRKLSSAIVKFSQEEGTTVFVTLLSVLNALVFRYTGQNDILLVCATGGRNEAKFENLIGYFVNMTFLRLREFSKELEFRKFLKVVHDSAASAFEHQEFPFQSAVAEADVPLDNKMTSLLRLGVTMEPRLCKSDVPDNSENPSTFFFEKIDYGSKFELLVCFDELDDQIHILFAFNKSVYDKSRIDLMASHFENFLENALGNSEQPIKLMDFMSPREKDSTLAYGLGPTCQTSSERLEELFEAQALHKSSQRTAIRSEAEALSYGTLNLKANYLKHALIAQTKTEDQFIAILLPQSIDFVISTLAILKSGKTVAPLSIDYSRNQLSYMLEHLKTPLLITTPDILRNKELAYSRVLYPGENFRSMTTKDEIKIVRNNPIAYCIFTSGSTGNPKAVLVRQDAIVNFVHWMRREYGVTSADKSLLFFTPAFDFSFGEMWPFLLSGGALYLPPCELRLSCVADINSWITANSITVACLPPVLAERFFNTQKASSLRWLITGGESLRSYPPEGLPYTVSNWYGLTEATVVTTVFHFDKDFTNARHHILPAGKPVTNAQIYILDPETKEFNPVGITGEIFIGGFGVSPGYYAQSPAVNEEKFIPDYLGLYGRLCRTGDLGYWLPGGNLVVIGRSDWQVKIRGFRLELAEIESALREVPGISQAIVVQKEADGLIGYCIGTLHGNFDLNKFLKERLPQYAIPTAVYLVQNFPLTPVGKIDRGKLLAMNLDKNLLRRRFQAPLSKEENILASIWSEVLNQSVEKISRTDDFFSLGGHSLLAVEVVSKLRAAPHFIETRVVDVFRLPILSDFAKLLIERNPKPNQIMNKKFKRIIQNFPLSFAQEQIWLHAQESKNPLLYNEAFSLDWKDYPEVYIPGIELSLFQIFQRHEILRSNIEEINGRPCQRIASLGKELPSIRILDLSQRSECPAQLEKLSRKLAVKRQRKIFRLESGSLFRVYLIKFRKDFVRLQVVFHHVVMDAVSVGIFERELRMFYEIFKNNRNVDIELNLNRFLEPPSMQYADYVLSQRKHEKQLSVETKNFWRDYLRDFVPLEIPTDFPRNSDTVANSEGEHYRITLNLETSERVKEFSRKLMTTPFVVFLTALKALMYRYSGQDDVLILSTTSGRNDPTTESLIGYFVNMIILRTKGFNSGSSFRQMAKRVQESTTRVLAHQDTPLQHVVSNSDLGSNKSDLFRLVLSMEPRVDKSFQCTAFSEGLKFQPKYELAVGIDEVEGCYNVGFLYNSALFSDSRIRNMASHFEVLLLEALASPQKKIQHLNLLTKNERNMILHTWNQTAVESPNTSTILQRFEEQVRKSPESIALINEFQGKTTYKNLNSDAERLATVLRNFDSAKPNEVVCVLLPQGKDFIMSTIAILKIGKICMPISAHVPKHQLESLLKQCDSPVVITTKVLAKSSGISSYSRILYVENIRSFPIPNARGRQGNSNLTIFNDVAYCIFTSGSTGVPKVVMVKHNGLANLINWMTVEFKLTAAEKSLVCASPAFDISFVEMWPFLCLGATLCLPPDPFRYDAKELGNWVHRNGITFASLPTATASGIFSTWEFKATRLKQVIFGGEKFQGLPKRRLPFKVTHCYGLSETTVLCTFAHLRQEGETRPSSLVGKPISNVQVYVLDKNNCPVPVGITGEIFVGGIGVSPGYYKNECQTVQKFLNCPFTENSDEKLCRTGDLGYWLADGNLCIVGRSDDQVKLGGRRIQLDGIEKAFTDFPAIEQAIVQIEEPNSVLTAYCILGRNEKDCSGIFKFLNDRLPYYEIPADIFTVPSFPLTSVGKIDRKALPKMNSAKKVLASSKPGGNLKPFTPAEKIVSEVWGKILNRRADSFNPSDNFFLIGGNSVMIMQVILELRSRTKRADIITSTIFANPVLAYLAKLIEGTSNSTKISKTLQRIDYASEKLNLTIPSGIGNLKFPQIENILLTGATGYLGSGILAELLGKTQAKIYCLIRARDPIEARSRIRRSIQKFYPAVLCDAALSRLICLVGDLTLAQFGLDDKEYSTLAQSITTVYHCAAQVHFLKSYEELKEANVESTKQVLRFVTCSKLKTIHYISTLGVLGYKGLGLNSKDKILKESPLQEFKFDANDLADGYSQSKWVAEALVWDAIACGVPGVIYRPGEIGSHSSKSIINRGDMFGSIVRSCLELKSFPDYKAKLPYGTLDFTSAAIVNLSLRNGHYGKVFHVFEHLVGLEEVFQNIQGGRESIPQLALKEWQDRLLGLKNNKCEAITLLSLFLCKNGDEGLTEQQGMEGISFSNINLMRELRGGNYVTNEQQNKCSDLRRYVKLLISNTL